MQYKDLFDGTFKLADRQQLQLDSKADDVRLLKRYLFAQGCGIVEWGDFSRTLSDVLDRQVERRIEDFQTMRRLVVDGVVGPKTWSKLMEKPEVLVQPGGTAATGMRAKLLKLISDPARQKEYRRRGLNAVFQATGGYSNACATTASQPLIDLGILKKPFFLAQQLADDMENRGLVKRITARSQVQPGDLIVCEDYNHNNLADHIWWALSAPDSKLIATCLDNQTGSLTHPRNLGQGPRTRMAYALRFS